MPVCSLGTVCYGTSSYQLFVVRSCMALLLSFLIVGIHACFWNFNSTVHVDVVRVKSYVNCLFDTAYAVMRITINKLYFFPEWLMSGVVGML